MVESQKKLLNLNADDDTPEDKKDPDKPDKSKGGIDVDDILDKIL
jgi:hypothetical protein